MRSWPRATREVFRTGSVDKYLEPVAKIFRSADTESRRLDLVWTDVAATRDEYGRVHAWAFVGAGAGARAQLLEIERPLEKAIGLLEGWVARLGGGGSEDAGAAGGEGQAARRAERAGAAGGGGQGDVGHGRGGAAAGSISWGKMEMDCSNGPGSDQIRVDPTRDKQADLCAARRVLERLQRYQDEHAAESGASGGRARARSGRARSRGVQPLADFVFARTGLK